MWRDIARFEWRLQSREFLTWVYVAVFFFLTFGYTSSTVVELVNGRHGIARNAPWALAQAMAGVTAFGQVITTMIAATAVMRDVTTRTQEMLFATRLSRGAYLGGRYLGALAVMIMVYAAIPVGLLVGSAMPWVPAGALLPLDASAYARPLVVLVLPNVLVVSALFFAAGALRRSFTSILVLGLTLVAFWTTGTSAARRGAEWGALLDPFGNAALEFATRGWSVAERHASSIPIDGVLLANRTLWLVVGSLAMWAVARFVRLEVAVTHARSAPRRDVPMPPNDMGAFSRGVTPSPPSMWTTIRIAAAWTARWTLREKGFRTIVALGTLNALANAWSAGGEAPDAGVVLASIQEHVRVFLILVATIYAGEVVWRERDLRSDELVDALPTAAGPHITGRIVGLFAAQAVLVAPLVLVALGVGWARQVIGMTPSMALTWIGGIVFPFVVCVTLLSLVIHAVLQDKVGGHVTLIVGWVLAVAMERTLVLPPLLRYGNLPPFSWNPESGFGDHAMRLVWMQLYWIAVAGTLGVIASTWCVRGAPSSFMARARAAVRQLQGRYVVVLASGVALATLTGWLASRA